MALFFNILIFFSVAASAAENLSPLEECYGRLKGRWERISQWIPAGWELFDRGLFQIRDELEFLGDNIAELKKFRVKSAADSHLVENATQACRDIEERAAVQIRGFSRLAICFLLVALALTVDLFMIIFLPHGATRKPQDKPVSKVG